MRAARGRVVLGRGSQRRFFTVFTSVYSKKFWSKVKRVEGWQARASDVCTERLAMMLVCVGVSVRFCCVHMQCVYRPIYIRVITCLFAYFVYSYYMYHVLLLLYSHLLVVPSCVSGHLSACLENPFEDQFIF